MDDELRKLEAELQRLRPVMPRAALREKLERQLGRRSRGVRRAVVIPWLAAAAAVWALVMVSQRERPAEVPAPAPAVSETTARFKPVAMRNVLLETRDEGYVTFADGSPARRVRATYLDTITWKDPRTQASLSWTVPREEVRVMPVLFQ